MTLILVDPPAAEPVSLAQAKAHLRVTHDSEDTLIAGLIAAARQEVERGAGLALLTQGWRLVLDGWPADGVLPLMRYPVQSVASVTVYDEAGEPAVLPASAYAVDALSRPGRVRMLASVPVGSPLNGIEVDYSAGFGAAGSDVPEALKRAILLLVAYWFEFRGAVSPGEQPVGYPPGYACLLDPFRLRRL